MVRGWFLSLTPRRSPSPPVGAGCGHPAPVEWCWISPCLCMLTHNFLRCFNVTMIAIMNDDHNDEKRQH